MCLCNISLNIIIEFIVKVTKPSHKLHTGGQLAYGLEKFHRNSLYTCNVTEKIEYNWFSEVASSWPWPLTYVPKIYSRLSPCQGLLTSQMWPWPLTVIRKNVYNWYTTDFLHTGKNMRKVWWKMTEKSQNAVGGEKFQHIQCDLTCLNSTCTKE